MDDRVKTILTDALSTPGAVADRPEIYRSLSRAAAEVHLRGADVAPDDVLDVVSGALHRLGVSPADHRVLSALLAVHFVRVLEALEIYDTVRGAERRGTG